LKVEGVVEVGGGKEGRRKAERGAVFHDSVFSSKVRAIVMPRRQRRERLGGLLSFYFRDAA